MRLVEQWREIERGLPESWGDAQLALTLKDEADRDQAAALLGPLNPGRHGNRLRFFTARRGGGFGPEHVRRLLRGLDETKIEGSLELLSTGELPLAPAIERPSLAAAWDEAVAALPSDWTDVYAELELTSTDLLDRAALLLAPLNPGRYGPKPGFRFRVASRFGYGAAPEMVRRCLERVDEDRIDGRLSILHVLSDTRPVGTQGPVWYVGGRAV